jgi:hypothetical protein
VRAETATREIRIALTLLGAAQLRVLVELSVCKPRVVRMVGVRFLVIDKGTKKLAQFKADSQDHGRRAWRPPH